jgi:predicted dehydrogenase
VPTFCLKAIYSRTQKSAETLAKGAGVDAYYESSEDKNLDALLKRADIQAVSIAVAISKSPEFIRKSLAAGKSVISEKPIAPSIEIAEELLTQYRAQNALWVVGENFRFWKSVNRAASILRKLDAKVLSFSCRIYHFIGADDKYFHVDW